MQDVEHQSTPISVNQNKKSDEDDMLTRLYNICIVISVNKEGILILNSMNRIVVWLSLIHI